MPLRQLAAADPPAGSGAEGPREFRDFLVVYCIIV